MQPFKEKSCLEQNEELKCKTPSPGCQTHKILGSPGFSHPRKQQVSPIFHGSLFLLYLCLQTQVLAAGTFQVQGPREPVVAILGGTAELLCSLSPAQNARNMQIRWSRTLTSQVVLLYKGGRDQPTETMESYKGRTELVKSVLNRGMAVLRIHNVQPSDNGQYYCQFKQNSLYTNTAIELKVAVLGSEPHFSVEITKSREIQLECKSEGWFPQPKMQWIDSHEGIIPNVSESHIRDKRGLFHSTILLLITETIQRNMTCSVWNPVLNQGKEGQLCIAVSSSSSLFTERMVWGTFMVILIVIIIVICLYIKVKKHVQAGRGQRHMGQRSY